MFDAALNKHPATNMPHTHTEGFLMHSNRCTRKNRFEGKTVDINLNKMQLKTFVWFLFSFFSDSYDVMLLPNQSGSCTVAL